MTSLHPATIAPDTTPLALKLYNQLSAGQDGSNVGFSPTNVAHVLALTANAAGGETRRQIAEATGITDTLKEQAFAYNLGALTHGVRAPNAITTAGKIYSDANLPVAPEFTDRLTRLFGAAHQVANLGGDPEGSRQLINADISNATNHLIAELLKEGFITTDTVMVLTTAIYMKMMWAVQFNPDMTQAAAFTLSNGGKVEAPLMNHYGASFPYIVNRELGVQAIRLPYQDSTLSFVAILPSDDISALEAKLSPANLTALLKHLDDVRPTELDRVALPRFSLDSAYDLVDTLKALGIQDAFTDAADFSGIHPSIAQGLLKITAAVHQAVIKVNEEGTEAAAASAVAVGLECFHPPVNFIADKPFIFVIRDKATGQIVFMGRVSDPSK